MKIEIRREASQLNDHKFQKYKHKVDQQVRVL